MERLCRYILRPPLATGRVERLPDGRVRVGLKRVWSDGTTAMEFSPLELTERLAALVPPFRAHQVVYAGVLAGNASWRGEVIPKVPSSAESTREARAALRLVKAARRSARPARLGWAELLTRVFGVDGWRCPGCGARMSLRTVVEGPHDRTEARIALAAELDGDRHARDAKHTPTRVALDTRSLSVDVGGGLTTPLRWLPGRRICIDPLAEHYAERCQLPLDLVTYAFGQGERLQLVSGTADLVICTNCVDHTDDPRAVVREVERVLKPGGWFWFSCEVNPPDQERNAGHPHALDRHAIVGLVSGFDSVLTWEEPWRGVYGFLHDRDPFPAVELGFLLKKAGAARAR